MSRDPYRKTDNIQVVSMHEDHAWVDISDGQTRVRARLSRDVLSQWSGDVGVPLDASTQGDVFQLKALIVVSSSFGSGEYLIWLDVLSISYCYHLRKLQGEPAHIRQDRHIKLLIEDINAFRGNAGILTANPDNRPPSFLPHVNDNATEHLVREDRSLMDEDVKPPSARFTEFRGPTSETTNETHNEGIEVGRSQTLASTNESVTSVEHSFTRKRVPNLNNDGFEVREGVNLAAPVHPTVGTSDDRVQSTRRIQTNDGSKMKLLGLLNKGKSSAGVSKDAKRSPSPERPECISETPARLSRTEMQTQMHDQFPSHTSGSRRRNSEDRSTSSKIDATGKGIERRVSYRSSHGSVSNVVNESNTATHIPDSTRPEPASVDDSAQPVQSIESNMSHHGNKEQMQQVPEPTASKQANIEAGSVQRYEHFLRDGRKRIPRNQQKLLDDSSSWFPSLPGKRFPIPNVPIELLAKWNEEQEKAAQAKPASSPSKHVGAEDESDIATDDGTDSPSESEEELHWEPTQSPPRAGGTPPESSPPRPQLRGTQTSDLDISPPRALPVRQSPTRPANHRLAPEAGPLRPVGLASVDPSAARATPKSSRGLSASPMVGRPIPPMRPLGQPSLPKHESPTQHRAADTTQQPVPSSRPREQRVMPPPSDHPRQRVVSSSHPQVIDLTQSYDGGTRSTPLAQGPPRTTTTRGPPSAPRHPTEIHLQKRREFMQSDRARAGNTREPPPHDNR